MDETFIAIISLVVLYIIKWIQGNTNFCTTIQQNKDKIDKLEQLLKEMHANNQASSANILLLTKIHEHQSSPPATPPVIFDQFKERQLRGMLRTNEMINPLNSSQE